MGEAALKYEHGIVKHPAAAADYASGEVVAIGTRIGVVLGLNSVKTGDPVAMAVAGVFEMDAATATTWSDGDVLDWAANLLVPTAAGVLAGTAVGAKVSGPVTGLCDINVRA